jgi:hypothetical protein
LADFFAAFFFVAMRVLLLELTKGAATAARPQPAEHSTAATRAPGKSNSSTRDRQGREPEGNGHAAAGFNAVRGAADGTVGAGGGAAGATGALTSFTAFLAAAFAFAFVLATARFTLRAPTAFLAFFATRRIFLRATAFFAARFTFARFTPRFTFARAAAFFFLPAFVAMFMLPSV